MKVVFLYFIQLLKFWLYSFKFFYFQKNSWPCWLDDLTWASSGLSETVQVYLKTQSLLPCSIEFSIVITKLCSLWLLYFSSGCEVGFNHHWWTKRLVKIRINICLGDLMIFVFFKTRTKCKRKLIKMLGYILSQYVALK